MSGPRRILLAQTSFLGDVVLTTPLARVLADAFPDAEIWWLTRPEAVALIAPLAGGRALAFDKRGEERGVRGLVRAARRLRGHGFDAAIGVQRSLRTAALLALARIPLRVGWRGSPGAALYHRRVVVSGAHARDRLTALASGLGVAPPSPPPDPELAVDAGAAERAAELLRAKGLADAGRLLALAPGSAWATKRWPARHFADAVRRLVPSDLEAVVLVGAAADRPAAAEVAARLADAGGPVPIDLTGRTTTGELAAVLARASLVIANDSAPGHIAAALGRPVVSVFGPTVPAQGFAPLGPRVRVAERALPCRPCSRHGGERCPIGTHECLEALGGDVVASQGRALLRAAAAAPGEPGRDLSFEAARSAERAR